MIGWEVEYRMLLDAYARLAAVEDLALYQIEDGISSLYMRLCSCHLGRFLIDTEIRTKELPSIVMLN